MSQAEQAHPISPTLLKELYRHAWPHNLKILLITGILIGFSYITWNTPNVWLRWLLYGAIGYLWMGIVTFMHDSAHDVLFKVRWKNWAFGILSTVPLLMTLIAFREEHLEHHRYNRTTRDPDAFTMGKRGVLDFVLFYSYLLVGGVLVVIHFTLLYPLQTFDRKKVARSRLRAAAARGCNRRTDSLDLTSWRAHPVSRGVVDSSVPLLTSEQHAVHR
jgi:fatty acid desaturase